MNAGRGRWMIGSCQFRLQKEVTIDNRNESIIDNQQETRDYWLVESPVFR